MILLSIILLISGYLLGTGITLFITRKREDRIKIESWQAAQRFQRLSNNPH